MNPRKVAVIVAAVSALVLGAAWFGLRATVLSPEAIFKRHDPEGARACELMRTSLRSQNTTIKLGAMLESAAHAQLAETNEIEASVSELLPGTPLADSKQLRDACVKHGFEMPPLAKTK